MPNNDPVPVERWPIYFLDLDTFARYYGLTLEVAQRRVARLVLLGYLEPAPEGGWTVHAAMPRASRGWP